MCKSRFALFMLAALVICCVVPAQPVSAKAPLGTNLSSTVYYSTELPFKNVGRMMDIRDESGRDRIYVMWDIEGHFPLGDYVILYDGTGNIDNISGGTVVEQTAGRIVISKSSGQGLSFLRDKTITNMRIILPGYEGSYESDRWNPSFLSKWQDFTVLRFMDWTHTNDSTQQNWSDRPLVSDESWSANGCPWEICIELANRLDADPWICIPHLATDDYVTQVANIVNSNMAAGHKVYVEYSNECWNGMFGQEQYCRNNGVAEGLSANEYQACDYWYSKRAVQIHDIFENIVGASRLVRVLSSQAGNTWRGENVLSYNNANLVTDAYAIAPYLGGEYDQGSIADEVENWTVDQLFDDIQTNPDRGLAAAKQTIIDNQAVADSYGVAMVCYEAGQHLVGVNGYQDNTTLTNLFISANRNTRMNDTYDTYLNDWDTHAGGLMCLFTSCSKYVKWGSWGLTEWHEQTDTPKYTAAMDWLGAAPGPPGQASNPSPADGATNQSVDVDLSWSAGSGATSHDVYFGQDSTPDSGEFQGNQTGTTFDPGTLANDTTYYWRIDEKNGQGTTTGTVWSFTTEAATPAPGQASNPSPADGATNQSVDVDISWTAGSDATSHDVYFGTPSSPPFVQNQAGTTYDPGALANSTTYYWRIDEKNAVGTTTGAVWSFTTTSGGGTPVSLLEWEFDDTADKTAGNIASTYNDTDMQSSVMNTGPGLETINNQWYNEDAFGVTGAETGSLDTDGYITWTVAPASGKYMSLSSIKLGAFDQSAGDDYYVELRWSDDSFSSYHTVTLSPGNPLTGNGLANTDGTELNGDLSGFAGLQSISGSVEFRFYIWGIIDQYNGTGLGKLGDTVVDVEIDGTTGGGSPPPGPASNPSPADGATNQSVDVDLNWTAGSDATSHDVYFGDTTTPPFIGNQTATTYDPGTLSNVTTYYWRIDEKNAGGTTTGTVWSFTTEAATPAPGQASNPSPADGATNQSVDVDISWTAGSDATSHDVYFGTSSSPPFVQNQAGTTYDPGTLANSTTYYWRIDEKNAVGTTTGTVWSFTTAAAASADADIVETSTAPTIDGSVDSVWSTANSYSIANVIVGTVSGDSDLSGTWRAMWDSSNLYYLVEITDDSLMNDSTEAWDDDSVEIFIDADNSKDTSYDGVNDYQYGFRWNDGTIHLGSNSASNTTGIVFTIADTANGYTLEVSIPWSTLGVTAAQGNLIGTDVQANDDDDGGSRDGKKAWYATNDNCWQDPMQPTTTAGRTRACLRQRSSLRAAVRFRRTRRAILRLPTVQPIKALMWT